MSANSSNIESLLHRMIASVSGTVVAQAIGTDDGHISRFQSGERGLKIDQIGPFIDVLGLKIVSKTDVTVDAEYLESIETLSRRGIGKRER